MLPLISVIMPVFNTEKYVSEAIESILNQTYTNFEFLIFDDASTDNSVQIINSFKDKRIQLITKPQNTGYTNSLNMGLKMAKGKYIARMDSDDISNLNRFEKQINFMEHNAKIDVCGSWFKILGSASTIKHPKNHDEIKVGLLSYCTIGHPTVIIRTKIIRETQLFYDPNFEPAEDYNLWANISMIGRLHNLQEVLLHYRLHDKQVSGVFKEKQDRISNEIKLSMLNTLLIANPINFNFLELEVHKIDNLNILESLILRINYIERLIISNSNTNIFNHVLFSLFMYNLKKNIITNFLRNSNSYNLKIFFSSLRFNCNNRSFIEPKIFFKYFIKSIIRYKK